MHKVLVAGGAGFIGSHLCKELLKKQYKIICLDNLITGSEDNIKELIANSSFEFIKCDVSKKEELGKIDCNEVAYVFHLASPASPNSKSPKSYINYPIETMAVNSKGTQNLLDIARENKAKFLYASTSEVYGNPKISPQNEEYFGNVNPNGPRSVYDEAKRFGEAITMAYSRKFNLDVVIVRIFNTYGPFMQPDDGRVVSNFINQVLRNEPITVYGDGHQTRSFCYIDDMVKGLWLAMFSNKTKQEVINLGNPNEQKIIELAEVIKKVIGKDSETVFEDLPQDDPICRKPDISKAKKILNWEPIVGIEEGVKKTVEYFKGVNK